MRRPPLEWLRPRNWLDGLGLSLEVVGLVGLIIVIIRSDEFFANLTLWVAENGTCIAIGLVGGILRRIAQKDPIFGR